MKINNKAIQHSWLRLGSIFIGVFLFGLMYTAQASAIGNLTTTPGTCTFTKRPGPPTYIQAGTPNLDVLIFEMDCSTAKSTTLKRMDFNFSPPVPAGWGNVPGFTNFRLIYFPNGLTHPGTIIGSNAGATFAGNSLSVDGMSFPLSKTFKGKFALRVDVSNNFTTSYAFTPALTGVTINIAGIDQSVVSASLPLAGDTFNVVQN